MYIRSPETLLRKQLRRKSKRDIIREQNLAKHGIEPLAITYGEPLDENIRKERIALYVQVNENTAKKFVGPKIEKKVRKRPTGVNRTVEQALRNNLRQARKRSRELDIPFNITLDDLHVPEYCPVLGIKLEFSDKITNNTPSIDRIVPEKGYVVGNVAIISAKANRLKNNATIEDLERIIAWYKKQLT